LVLDQYSILFSKSIKEVFNVQGAWSRKGTVPIIAILLDVENEIKISSAGKGKGHKTKN
jgi:hypothetical protein